MIDTTIVLYQAEWCPYCARVRSKLTDMLLDYKKMYQTQFCLQGIQELLSSKRLIFEDDTANVIGFVQHMTRDDFFPKQSLQLGEIKSLDATLEQALAFKYITAPLAPKDVAGLFDILAEPARH